MSQLGLFGDDPGADGTPDDRPLAGPLAASDTSARPPRHLVVEADGGSRGNPGPAGYGALVRESGKLLAERAAFIGASSNNVAEYSGLIAGLQAVADIDPYASVEVRMDSKLVVEQMSGRWKIKHADMQRLARQARALLDPRQVTYTWVPRAENNAADTLANEAMDTGGHIARDYFEATEEHGEARTAGVAPAHGHSGPSPDWPALAQEEAAPPMPDLDTGAPSWRRDDVLTLVLASPGMTPAESSAGDPELSLAGVELAGAAAALVDRVGESLWPTLPEPSLLLSSPLVRAQQVAVLLSEATGLGAPMVERDLAALRPGEEVAQLAERVAATLDRLTVAYPGHTVVVAAHAAVIAAVIGTVAGLATSHWEQLRIAPGTLSVVRSWPGGGEVHVLGTPAQQDGDDR